MDLHDIFDCTLVDLGRTNSGLAGVFIPESEIGTVPAGVTSQFIEDAEVYHEKHFDTVHTDWLLTNALARLPDVPGHATVLDIGSGSGQSVFSLLHISQNFRVIAADISPNLLGILNRILKTYSKSSNVSTVCLDLNKRWFKNQPFDFAVGAAILHHLFEPETLIAQVFQAVKPGGSLIFFEPFEAGHAVLGLLYRQLLDAADSNGGLDEPARLFFRQLIHGIRQMKCQPKPLEEYRDVDDKWTFSRKFFEGIARRIGAEELIIYPTYDIERPFTDTITTHLRLGLGRGREGMPRWAWDRVEEFEDSLSRDFREEVLMHACVIFRKPLE